MKRFLVLALVAVAGVFAAGSTAQANHPRYVGHNHYGGYGGGYNRGFNNYGYRPSFGVSVNFGAPVYRQSYGYRGYGGGYRVPSYGYGYPLYGYGGGYCR